MYIFVNGIADFKIYKYVNNFSRNILYLFPDNSIVEPVPCIFAIPIFLARNKYNHLYTLVQYYLQY